MIVGRVLISGALLALVFGAGFYAAGGAREPQVVSLQPSLESPVVVHTRPVFPPLEGGAGDPKAQTLAEEERKRSEDKKIEGLTRRSRKLALPAAEVVAALAVKPGMTVVDVGAGSGYFTSAFLGALKGQGKLYATDADGRMLKYIQSIDAELGYGNLKTVEVARVGVDPFYTSHTFDLIFLSSVFEYLPDPVAFFGALRGALVPETGRIAILQGVPDDHIYPHMVKDAFLWEKFLAEGPEFPPYQRLSPHLKRALKELLPTQRIGPRESQELSAAFMKMLGDPGFFWEVVSYLSKSSAGSSAALAHLKVTDLHLLQWLVYHVEEFAAGQGSGVPASAAERSAVATLGRFILLPYFNLNRMGGAFYFARALYLSNASVERRMAEAGFELDQEIHRFEGHAFMIFRRSAR